MRAWVRGRGHVALNAKALLFAPWHHLCGFGATRHELTVTLKLVSQALRGVGCRSHSIQVLTSDAEMAPSRIGVPSASPRGRAASRRRSLFTAVWPATFGGGRAGPCNAHTSRFGSFSTACRDEPEIEANLDALGDLNRQYITTMQHTLNDSMLTDWLANGSRRSRFHPGRIKYKLDLFRPPMI